MRYADGDGGESFLAAIAGRATSEVSSFFSSVVAVRAAVRAAARGEGGGWVGSAAALPLTRNAAGEFPAGRTRMVARIAPAPIPSETCACRVMKPAALCSSEESEYCSNWTPIDTRASASFSITEATEAQWTSQPRRRIRLLAKRRTGRGQARATWLAKLVVGRADDTIAVESVTSNGGEVDLPGSSGEVVAVSRALLVLVERATTDGGICRSSGFKTGCCSLLTFRGRWDDGE